MLRLLGVILILGGMWGVGARYLEREKNRIQLLEKWEYIFSLLESEITYKKQPLSLAGREIGIKVKGEEGKILQKISEEIENGQGESFFYIWQEQWEDYLKKSNLAREEQDTIRDFSTFIGYEEEKLQNEMISMQKEKIKAFRIRVQEENREKQRIVLLLSSCGGILLVLVLW